MPREQNGYAASTEREAAMAWTRICEGEDAQAHELIEGIGYLGALNWLKNTGQRKAREEYSDASARWRSRYDESTFVRDRRAIESIGGFLMPTDPAWPASLSDLGSTCPLGLWYVGNTAALDVPSMAIVGTRDASQYGTRIATDFSYELARMGVTIVSGGAFGIDAAAHRGALAAKGKTVVVLAGGVDRPYPVRNERIFSAVVDSGGLLISEVPPGASPHRHRFLARNRIIAAMTRATLVVEAPFRSGAINTARHALEIGHEVGAVPGPLSSPRSAGCHRLLRESATCITSAAQAVELLGYTPIFDGVQEELDFARGSNGSINSGNFQPSQNPLTLRVRDALPVSRPSTVQKVAATAGLSIQETLRGLGSLEMEGTAESLDGKWCLAKERGSQRKDRV